MNDLLGYYGKKKILCLFFYVSSQKGHVSLLLTLFNPLATTSYMAPPDYHRLGNVIFHMSNERGEPDLGFAREIFTMNSKRSGLY